MAGDEVSSMCFFFFLMDGCSSDFVVSTTVSDSLAASKQHGFGSARTINFTNLRLREYLIRFVGGHVFFSRLLGPPSHRSEPLLF